MTTINLHPFGDINTDDLADDFYESELVVSGRPISIDLSFDEKSINKNTLKNVEKLVNGVSELQDIAFSYMLEDYKKGDESDAVELYVEHHLEELDKSEIEKVFGSKNVDINLFLSKLVLTRIGIYADRDDGFAIFDFTLPGNITDYLIVVTFDQNGIISDISMES